MTNEQAYLMTAPQAKYLLENNKRLTAEQKRILERKLKGARSETA